MIGRSDGKFPRLSGFRALPLQVVVEGKGPISEEPLPQIGSSWKLFGVKIQSTKSV